MDETMAGYRIQEAIYHRPAVAAYQGNPYIEALPPLLERDEARGLMAFYPDYDHADRAAPPIQREHLASLVSAIRHPIWLHGELYSRISRLITAGYIGRNPILPDFQRNIDAREGVLTGAALQSAQHVGHERRNGGYLLRSAMMPRANGLTFLGTSGIGKTAAVEMVLGLYPQMILHREYNGRVFSTIQIPWMKLDIPADGSVKALAERFFLELDAIHTAAGLISDYYATYCKRTATEDKLAPRMARVAAQVGLGFLVLDELQDLSAAKSRKMLSFLVQLVNVVGVPVVLVGGLDALKLVTEQFRQARRGSTEGDLIVSHSQNGQRWRDFCEILWKYQYTTNWVPMTPEHADALYEVSQGITDFLVIAYKNAQVRAIAAGLPHVTPRVIRSVRDSLAQAGPALGALRRRSAFVIDRMSDLSVPSGWETLPFLRGDETPQQPLSARSGEKIGKARPTPEPRQASVPGNKRAGVHPSPVAPHSLPGNQNKGGLKVDAAASVNDATLTKIVEAGRQRGVSPRESLRAAGFGVEGLWRRIIGIDQ